MRATACKAAAGRHATQVGNDTKMTRAMRGRAPGIVGSQYFPSQGSWEQGNWIGVLVGEMDEGDKRRRRDEMGHHVLGMTVDMVKSMNGQPLAMAMFTRDDKEIIYKLNFWHEKLLLEMKQ